MPNWCECDLTVKGPKDEIDRMLAERSSEADPNGRPCDREKRWIDFNKVIPYAKEFASQDEIVHIERQQVEAITKGMGPDERKAFFHRFGNANRAAGFDPYGPKDGYNSGGYEWCVRYWGTKWPAGDFHRPKQSDKCFRVSFSTPWGPALPVFQELSVLHPELEVTLRYYERGMGFQGIAVFKAGRILKDKRSNDYNGSRGG